jgi:hypothetical protein
MLDEHVSPVVARQLRRRGHDVVALVERPDLRGSDDAVVLAIAAREVRALVTADAGFRAMATRASAWGDGHAGVVMISRAFRARPVSIGPLVQALDALLRRSPAEDALADRVIWLKSYSSR